MRIQHIIVILFAALVIQACSSTQYISDSLGPVDVSQYHTYSMEDNCADDINPIMQIRIKNALEMKLRANDYSKSDNGDVLVKYFVKNTNKKYVEECNDEYERWEGGRMCQERVVTYVEGSIVIDIIDTRTNRIIWHGAAYGPSWSSISDPNKKVNDVVDNLLERYFSL